MVTDGSCPANRATTGGAPVAVTNYGVRIKRRPWPLREHGNLFVVQRPSWATPIPAVVQPGGEPVTVLVPVADLRRLHDEESVPFRGPRRSRRDRRSRLGRTRPSASRPRLVTVIATASSSLNSGAFDGPYTGMK